MFIHDEMAASIIAIVLPAKAKKKPKDRASASTSPQTLRIPRLW
jgi:hypothetical protein